MIAQVLSTGDEILSGDVVDTNAAYLCRALRSLGFCVEKITAVKDDKNKIAKVLKRISKESNLCFVTGGLGLTIDDVTAKAAAMAAKSPLILHPDALHSMKQFFKKRKAVLTKANEKQAWLPLKAHFISNHNGTAPGFFLAINGCDFAFMPGVPSEMKSMFEKEIKPRISEKYRLSKDAFIERICIFGLPESETGEKLKDFGTHFPNNSLGFRAVFPHIELKVTGDDEKSIAGAKAWIIKKLKDKVVSDNGLNLAQEIGRLLKMENKTLAIAESCTGGLVSSWITDVDGSSGYFLFSAVTYANHAKMKVLGVREKTLIKYGAVSEQTAQEMAQGARNISGADIAISTTGIAGPSGGTKQKPVGMVCIGLASTSIKWAKTFQFNFGDRDKHKQIFAATALDVLRTLFIKGAKAF